MKRALPYFFFFLFSIIYFWPVLFGSAILLPTNPKTIPPWNEFESSEPSNGLMIDSLTLLYPWRVFNSNVLRSGEVPHWNPYIFCGYPHLAALQTNSLYPGTILFDLLDPVRGIAGSMALHLALSGVFMFLFLKRIGLSPQASFLGALTYEFNGMFLVRMSSPTYVFSAVWIPMMLIGAHALAQKLSLKNSLPLIFGVALSFLGGHPQIFLNGVVIAGLFFLFELRHNFSIRKLFTPVFIFGCACLAGLALAAFELLPFGELIRNSSRESIPLEIYKKAAPPFVIAIQAIISDFFGNPVDKNYWFNQGAELLGRGNKFGAPWSFNYSGENLFSGIIPLFLAGIALFKSRSVLALFFSSLLFASLGILFGTPILDAVYYLIPTFRFSRPDRVIIIYMFCMSALVAVGYHSLLYKDSSNKTYGKWIAAAFGVLALIVIAPYLFESHSFNGLREWINVAGQKFRAISSAKSGFLVTVILLVTGGVLAILMSKIPASRTIMVCVWALLIFLPCYFFGWKFNPLQRSPLFPTNEAQNILTGETSKELYRIVRIFGRRGQKYFPSNISGTMDVFDVNGASAAPVYLYADFVRSIDPRAITKEKYFWEFTNPRLANRPLFDFLNVKYVISDTALPFDEEPLYRKDQFRIYKNPRYLPRFFLAYSAEPYKDAKQAQMNLKDWNFNAGETVLISEEQLKLNNIMLSGNGSGSVRVVSYEPNRIELEVKSDKSAILVSSESYYPGWRAAIDGQTVATLLVNTAFRGVHVPAGTHRATFMYHSTSFRIGTFISILALGILLSALFFKAKP